MLPQTPMQNRSSRPGKRSGISSSDSSKCSRSIDLEEAQRCTSRGSLCELRHFVRRSLAVQIVDFAVCSRCCCCIIRSQRGSIVSVSAELVSDLGIDAARSVSIPYTARELLRTGNRPLPVDLKGIAIGNGFIDPRSQYGSDIELMVERNLWKAGGEVRRACPTPSAIC